VIVIGKVVELREHLRWYDSQPLFGKRVLVPRSAAQAQATAVALRERGAEPVVFPLIAIDDPPDCEPLRCAISELASYRWVLFTSKNGVERLFSQLSALGRDARAFGAAKIGVIGPGTADALRSRGVIADLEAREHIGEALADAVIAEGGSGRVLIPRALEAREALPQALRQARFEVDVVPAYRTRRVASERAGELAELLDREIDVILLTASSTVRALVEALGDRAADLVGRATLASIGPVTTRTAVELGLRVDVTGDEYTVEGLLDALERHCSTTLENLRGTR
jgi:uroporphyrinogen III methyltransferase/synthase